MGATRGRDHGPARRARAPTPTSSLPRVKEPRFFLSDGSAPPRRARRRATSPTRPSGPGTAAEYEALFDPAPRGTRLGEATPYYLSDRSALERIRNAVPRARLVAILRNPVDRAHSNWNRQWSDTFETPRLHGRGRRRGAPRGEGTGAGRGATSASVATASRSSSCSRCSRARQLHVVRYRDLVETPAAVLDGVCRFLDVPTDVVTAIPPVQVSDLRPPGPIAATGGRPRDPTAPRPSPGPPHRRNPGPTGLPGFADAQRPELTPEERSVADRLLRRRHPPPRGAARPVVLGLVLRRGTGHLHPTPDAAHPTTALEARRPGARPPPTPGSRPTRSVAAARPIDCRVAAARLDA